jgi:hypothetical protein
MGAPGILGPDFWPGILARDLARGSPRTAAAPAGALPRAPPGAVSRARFRARFGGRFRARFWARSAGRQLPSVARLCGQRRGRPTGRVSAAQRGRWARLFPGALGARCRGVEAEALPALRKADRRSAAMAAPGEPTWRQLSVPAG